MPQSRPIQVLHWTTEASDSREDQVAEEIPVALSYNKRSHVVMMATPDHIDDLAIGFSLTEGIIDGFSDIHDLRVVPREHGLEAALTINEACFERLQHQRRNLVGRTGCGLCGTESLEQAVRLPSAVESRVSVPAVSIQKAIGSLNSHQPLQRISGAVHGAAWCNREGQIQMLREDVGRHNALDKLIGKLCKDGFQQGAGFVLVSSRASYEMVYKCAAVGIEVLVAVSAATAMAIDFASRCGMTLVGFARPGRHNIYTFERRITEN